MDAMDSDGEGWAASRQASVWEEGLGGVQADPDGEGLTTPAPRLGPRYLPLPFPPPPPTMAVLLSLGPDKRASSAEGWPVARPQTLLGGR